MQMLKSRVSPNEWDVLEYIASLEIESPIPVKNRSIQKVVEEFGVTFPKQGVTRLISDILFRAGFTVTLGYESNPKSVLRQMEYNGIWLFELGDEPELSLHGGNCVHIFKFTYEEV